MKIDSSKKDDSSNWRKRAKRMFVIVENGMVKEIKLEVSLDPYNCK